jgi:hypothetical protein
VTTVRVPAATKRTEVALALAVASPDLARLQWASTYGPRPERVDANESVALLAQAMRSPRLVVVGVDGLGAGARVRGALALRAQVQARDERQGDVDGATRDLLESLLVKGGVVENKSVFKKPLFWIAITAVAVASSAVTAYLFYNPGSRTEVVTR